ncbi:MAG TPA: hypothetical protein VMF30_02895 [Pirellulales bacterium]|nr:hypothetical protein [Pirellulales bacterium]
MATTDSKSSRPVATTPSTGAGDKSAGKTATARRGGRGRRLRWLFFWFPLLVFVTAVGMGPSVVSWTPLGRQLISRFAPLDGSLEIQSLSIGWFSALNVEGVVARDSTGNTVAEIAAVRGDKPLWAVIASPHELGQIEVEQPAAHVILRPDGSNVEDLLRPLLAGNGGGQIPPVNVLVKVAGGQATIDDQSTKRGYAVQDLAVELDWQGVGDSALNLKTTAKFIDRRRTTDLSLLLSAEMGDEEHPLGKGRLACHCDQLPLDVLAPVVRRALADAQLAGRLTVEMEANWGGGQGGEDASVAGQVDVADLLFASALLGPDRLEIAKLQAPCRIVGKEGQIAVEQLLIDCDLGKVSVTGSLSASDLLSGDPTALLTKAPCQISGRLDLVRLAALFPHLLALRPGTEITAGELNVALASQPAAGGGNWTGSLDTSDLEAVSDGRPLAWKQPLQVDFRMRDAGGGLIVDNLECKSNFLQVAASGTLEQLTASAQFDLAQLATELSRFVDLDAYQLAGTGDAHVTCQTDAAGELKAQAEADLRDFALVAPARQPWREPRIVLHANAAGTVAGAVLRQIASADVQLQTSSDQLTVQLAQAVENPVENPCPVIVGWQGDLAGMLPRIAPWFDLTGWDLSGRGNLKMTAMLGIAAVDVQQLQASFEPLHLWGRGLFLDEPSVEVMASGRWTRADGKTAVSLASLRGASWVARVNNAGLNLSPSGFESSGNATLETDLGTIGRWTTDPRVPAARQFGGQLAGKLDWSANPSSARGTLSGNINNLQVALPATAGGAPAVWQEQQVTAAVDLDYDAAGDQLQIGRGELTASALAAQVGGKVTDVSQAPNVELQGQILADWQRLAPLWRPYAGPDVQIEGQDPWPFSLSGPVTLGAATPLAALERMAGQATVSWQRANVRGIEVGHGAINAVLKDGVLAFVPVGVEISGGKVLVTPLIRLATQPPEVELPRGPAIDHMELTSKNSERALKFITPVLSEVTQTKGQFSVTLAGGRVPLANPLTADISGQLIVHSVSMQPGRILQTLLGFAQQIEGLAKGQIPFAQSMQPVSLMRIENQTVDFRMVGGRVYHRGLQFTAGNVTITSKGSVGLDESLSVVAEIPMHAGLLGGNSKLKGVNGDSLQIPIEGTLEHPKIDPRIIEKLTGAVLKTTIVNPLKQLEKLVPGEPTQ